MARKKREKSKATGLHKDQLAKLKVIERMLKERLQQLKVIEKSMKEKLQKVQKRKAELLRMLK